MIQSARDYLLQNYLPSTSEIDRELWLRTNEIAQMFLEIMKNYSKEIVDACYPDFNGLEENKMYLHKIKNQI